MQLTWVNHASFVVRHGPVNLICDPWIEGPTFNNGWQLFSPTRFTYDDFAGITHIWFSHEHPDHFNPPNLRKIPEEIRKKITVLFHETKDKRVIKVCEKFGFKVQELPEAKTVEIGPDFRIVCGRQGLLDSWNAIFAEGKTLLNMNDCVFGEPGGLEGVRDAVGKVDVLFTQFSYANWVGNPGDVASHRQHAERKRDEIKRQADLFRPKQLVPFASYVFFCHDDNFFMNDSVNHISSIQPWVSKELGIPCLVFYPGDVWEVGFNWESSSAVEKYEADLMRALQSTPLRAATVSLETLQAAANEYVAQCEKKNNPLLLRTLKPAVARLSDLGKDVEISFRRGVQPVENRTPDIILSSDSLLYCLKTDWGGDTLAVNGRYEVPDAGMRTRFFHIFRVAAHNSYGDSLDFAFVGQQVVARAKRAVMGRFGA
jgi:UDP-MurNAc hydroxylase